MYINASLYKFLKLYFYIIQSNVIDLDMFLTQIHCKYSHFVQLI